MAFDPNKPSISDGLVSISYSHIREHFAAIRDGDVTFWTAFLRTIANGAGGINVAIGGIAANVAQRLHIRGLGATSATEAIRASNSSAATTFKVADNGDAYFLGKVTERGNAVGIGVYQSFTPARGASAGTWTGGVVNVSRYAVVGNKMRVVLNLTGSSVSAVPSWLAFTIPGGYISAVQTVGLLNLADNGVAKIGSIMSNAADSAIYLTTAPNIAGTWATSAGTTSVFVNFEFEIQ